MVCRCTMAVIYVIRKELEECDTLDLARAAFAEDDNFDAPEGIDLMTNTHSCPDGGEARV